LSRKALENDGLDNKTIDKTRNMFALGMIYYIFDRSMETTCHFFETKFAKKPQMIAINKKVLEAGHHYAEAAEIVESTINIGSAPMEKGRYRNITGNVATAWGLLAAAEKSGRPLFLGSYPITPATDILIEITKRRDLGAKAFQAEDEIAGICSTIGASFAGSLACTSTSGPGLSLMSEALGLAVITELPIVVVDVQRGGPSTGLPTKSEQSDLYQALFGRNGEAPLIVIASSTPANCFQYAYEAAKLAMEHMTPCILLSDGSIGNGSQLFRIPKMADMPAINPPIVPANDPDFKPYLRNPETLVRGWALPGTEGLRHRIGGLEKEDIYGNVSTDPMNHATMTRLRREKVEKIADCIPEQKVDGDADADLLVVSWGGTEGAVNTAVKALQAEGKSIAHAHFNYIMPLPKNTAKVLEGHKKIVVCELNEGQFVNYLRGKFDHLSMKQYNKIQGLPFTVSELTECFEKLLAE
ncbi:MAG: 2-oxoacid:acceptor oxidoreductase subunit alpha, partial [Bacteroidales bacterium]|nr:2-oxoacid:acceptor oxidoreductase subunit alpha [Bacteroidales bacterium]